MQFGAVTFVLTETVFWKLRTKLSHHCVACHLRNHARGRDRQAVTIAIDNGSLGKRKRKHRPAIDKNMIGRRGDGRDGGPHRFMRGAQDIDLIDLPVIHHADGPGDFDIGD